MTNRFLPTKSCIPANENKNRDNFPAKLVKFLDLILVFPHDVFDRKFVEFFLDRCSSKLTQSLRVAICARLIHELTPLTGNLVPAAVVC